MISVFQFYGAGNDIPIQNSRLYQHPCFLFVLEVQGYGKIMVTFQTIRRIALCERFEYATEAVRDAEGALKADFTLMKLEEGRNAFVSLIDKTTGEILYTANLVDDILMFRGDAGEPPYSLECDHDFPITLKLKYEKETWMLIQATVLDWNVVSRPIEMEN